jgi:hypothetical protein
MATKIEKRRKQVLKILSFVVDFNLPSLANEHFKGNPGFPCGVDSVGIGDAVGHALCEGT